MVGAKELGMKYDVLLDGGEVIDPSQSLHGKFDVAVSGERIAAIAPDLPVSEASHVIDARNRLVVPGLIDLHVHAYRGHTTLGIDPDAMCSSGGVTTMLDTGSAGSHNFSGFLRDVIIPAQTEVLALIHLSAVGLATFNRTGEFSIARSPIRTVQSLRSVPILGLPSA